MQLMLDMMKVKIAGIKHDSVVDGDGVRFVIFFQGCPHKCDGCHNEHTWDPDSGFFVKLSNLFEVMENLSPRTCGITLSGGEPFFQEDSAYLIAKKAHELNMSVWTYTGYLYESLRDDVKPHPLLNLTDMLVDGPYIKKLRFRDINAHRGSLNQRVIDLKAARKTGCIEVDHQKIFVPFKIEES